MKCPKNHSLFDSKLLIPDDSSMRFSANKFTIGSDYLCLTFPDVFMNFERINKLIFEVTGKEYEYIKNNLEAQKAFAAKTSIEIAKQEMKQKILEWCDNYLDIQTFDAIQSFVNKKDAFQNGIVTGKAKAIGELKKFLEEL